MDRQQLNNIIEAALMVSDQPLNLDQLSGLFIGDPERPERTEILAALRQMAEDYHDRGIEIKEVASGFRIQTKMEYAKWMHRLFEARPPRYSRALLETLAIIAYRQPLTRAEIEEIRGVSISSNIIRTLQARDWIRVVGQRDLPGRPELLATTKAFLDYFNLTKLAELPALSEIKDYHQINPDLFETSVTKSVPSEGSKSVKEGRESDDKAHIADNNTNVTLSKA